jgi:hypothetical protein
MPKPRTTAKGFPCDPADCYVSRHLDGPDFKIHSVMCAAAPSNKGKRTFYAPVRPWLCNAVNQAPSTVDATLDRLEAGGWIINLGRTRRADGTETPNTYEIVEHAAWADAHPGACPDYKLAPDWEEALKYGVRKGGRITSGPLPKNFWPDDPILRSALEKVTSEEPGIITDEELAALNKHLDTLTTPGTPRLAPLPGNEAPLPVDRDWTTPGTPVSPLPVDREHHSRLTGRNLSKPTLVNTPNTPHPTTQLVGGVVDGTPSAIDAEREVDDLLAGFAKANDGPGKFTGTQRKKITELVMRYGRDKFRRAADAWFANPSWNNKTTDPFLGFINGFAGYLAASDIAIKEQQSKLTPAQVAEINELNAKRRAEFWGDGKPEETVSEPDADAMFADDEK